MLSVRNAPVALKAFSGWPLVPARGAPLYVCGLLSTSCSVGSATNVAPYHTSKTVVLNGSNLLWPVSAHAASEAFRQKPGEHQAPCVVNGRHPWLMTS